MNEAASTSEVASRVPPPLAVSPSPNGHARQHILLSLTFGFFVLGVLLALQVNTQRAIREGSPIMRPPRYFQERLQETEKKLRGLEQQNAELKARVAKFEASMGQSSQQTKLLKNELEAARILAGITPVQGPGIVVTVSDKRKPIKVGDENYGGIVHDEDLLQVANELWNAGAEAVAINGIRLASRWNVRCAGTTINVNNQRITSPCKIEAIGDAAILQNAVNLTDGIADQLRTMMQLKVTVKTASMLHLAGATPERPKIAKPAPEPKREQD